MTRGTTGLRGEQRTQSVKVQKLLGFGASLRKLLTQENPLKNLLAPILLLSMMDTTSAQTPANPQTQRPASIDLATARRLVAAAEQTARAANAKVGIAVVNANGDLVLLERLDGSTSRGVISA